MEHNTLGNMPELSIKRKFSPEQWKLAKEERLNRNNILNLIFLKFSSYILVLE